MRPLTLATARFRGLAAFAALCAAGFAVAGPVEAKALQPSARHVPRHPTRYAHRIVRLATPTPIALRRQDAPALAPPTYQRDRLPTAFTYQVARNGPEGSVGFHRPTIDPWSESQGTSRGLASSLHLDRPEPTFGAELSVPLR